MSINRDFYTTAARITVGTTISTNGGGAYVVTRKDRQVNGNYRIYMIQAHGEKPCGAMDVYHPRQVLTLG